MFSKTASSNILSDSAHHPSFRRTGGNFQRSHLFIQPKLKVDSSTSIYEREADRMADFVVQSGIQEPAPSFISPAPLQRMPEPTVEGRRPDPATLLDQILPPELAALETSGDETEPEKNPPEEKSPAESATTPDATIRIPEQPSAKKEENIEVDSEEEPEGPVISEESGNVPAEDSAAFKGEPNLEPVAPVPITTELTNQFLQTKALNEATKEDEVASENEESSYPELGKQVFSAGDEANNDLISRKGHGGVEVSADVEKEISVTGDSGDKLPAGTQAFMEAGFGTDFSDVRVHHDNRAAGLNNKLQAKAFTHQNHIYFNSDQYRPSEKEGQHLLAHELTHVVQQGGGIQRKPQISKAAPGKIQRLSIGDALDFFADKAHYIPGFRMFTIILGVNPINMERVDRSAANIIRAMVEFLPGGKLITDALENAGIFEDATSWFKGKIDSLNITGAGIRSAINEFLDSLGWSDIFDLGGVWRRAKRIIIGPINRLINFAKALVSKMMDMVKSAIIKPLALLAEGTPAYDLLRVVLGEDPITGDLYPPTAGNLIGGFMKLIGQEEIWENIKKGNAVEQAFSWFKGALQGLKGFVRKIPSTIINTLKSLSWRDLVMISNAFRKVGGAFLNVAGKFVEWAGGTVLNLLEILFSVIAPGAVPWIKKAGDAFANILKNPVGFVGNLVKAAKKGFQNFAANIGKHLQNALINWLTGSLAGTGVHIPQDLSFQEIIQFVLSALGVTWDRVREKLVKHIGEPAVKALEAGFELVRILLTQGPMAMWEKIQEKLSDLKAMVMEEISSWVITKVVTKAVTKLVTSLNPAGAVIQAILFIYDTITFLVDKISEIAKVGMTILNSMSAIAGGVINTAIEKVEKTLAGMFSLSISFLAKLLGLGKISEKIIGIVKKLQDKVDKAIDKVIAWIVEKGKAFLKKVVSTGVPEDPKARLDIGLKKAVQAVNKLSGKVTQKLIIPVLEAIKLRYDFQYLRPIEKDGYWYIEGKVNPDGEKPSNKTLPSREATDQPISKFIGKEIFKNDNAQFTSEGNSVKSEIEELGYQFVKSQGKYHIRRKSSKDTEEVHITEEGELQAGSKSGHSAHTEYKPVITNWNFKEGGLEIHYTYEEGDQQGEKFTTLIDFGEEAKAKTKTITSIGENISIKQAGTRGKTDSSGSILGETFKKKLRGNEVHSAHLIADWFRGSGYAGSGNIIPASAKYNQNEMRKKEKEIRKSVGKQPFFNLEVKALMKVYSDSGIESAIEKEKLQGDEKNNFSSKEVSKVMDKLSKELDPMYAEETIYHLNQKEYFNLSEDKNLKDWIE